MMTKPSAFLIAATLAATLAAIGCGHVETEPASANNAGPKDAIRLAPGNPQRDFVKVEPVAESDAAGFVTLTGRIAFDEDHTQRVASPIDGRVISLAVEPGSSVKAGQRLLELTSADVGRIQADAQKGMQDLGVAQKSLDRVHKLRADGAVSDKELAQAEADSKKALADVQRNEAQLKALGISASDPAVNASLRAQISGTVVSRPVLVGQEIRADGTEPLVTITNLDTVWVLADVYEQDLGLVAAGDRVRLRALAYPDETFEGVVGYVGDVVDPQSRTVKLRCVFANPAHRLKPEMFVKVDVLSKPGKKVMLIPAKAVVNEGEIAKVIAEVEPNVFRERRIEIGPERDGQVRVLSGVRPGDKIVTEGALFVDNELRD
ncbi:MAG TPA: efflux RND transporter periplasmic adaptor subunit [Polyangiales bacterium]